MPETIRLSDGSEYRAVLIVQRDTMNPRAWVGFHANPENTCGVGTEGECSRQYFPTARAAVFNLSRRFGIEPGRIPVVRGSSLGAYVRAVARGSRLQLSR